MPSARGGLSRWRSEFPADLASSGQVARNLLRRAAAGRGEEASKYAMGGLVQWYWGRGTVA